MLRSHFCRKKLQIVDLGAGPGLEQTLHTVIALQSNTLTTELADPDQIVPSRPDPDQLVGQRVSDSVLEVYS